MGPADHLTLEALGHVIGYQMTDAVCAAQDVFDCQRGILCDVFAAASLGKAYSYAYYVVWNPVQIDNYSTDVYRKYFQVVHPQLAWRLVFVLAFSLYVGNAMKASTVRFRHSMLGVDLTSRIKLHMMELHRTHGRVWAAGLGVCASPHCHVGRSWKSVAPLEH
jgi:hypothetical protein